ncbi:EGF-containing fibulin-like extracellular matrix protein 1 [Dendronephthya gigantea]|uniref:EGF-containing fibulin-like extracellular matrix protein 1 n=1 Tax=Dendronephthya gigantea TaxID=151771 RepID=UPI00106A8C74|nr:EGF-containing fibulin-like extracellular matrix protein 1 [Dendronephthya gigantea]
MTCAMPEKLKGSLVKAIKKQDICGKVLPCRGLRCSQYAKCIKNATTHVYKCACRAGYKGNGAICKDLNECTLGTHRHICDNGRENCINTIGSFECRCKPGLKINNKNQCDDVNECETEKRCPEEALCINNIGSYQCICKAGFSGDGKKCEDIDECERGDHGCPSNSVCVNSEGDYKCFCNAGYVKSGHLCVKEDPCLPPHVPCNPEKEICVKSKTSYECHCKPGFKRASESGECEDKNECEGNETNQCHKFATCVNQKGGYKYKIDIKTYALAGLIVGIPVLTFVALTIYVCKRRVRRRAMTREAEYTAENPPNDDTIPPDNQQLINTAGSYYEESIPMKGLPASESAWSEWPDYDDTRESDSD